jgi:uncharacterized protein
MIVQPYPEPSQQEHHPMQIIRSIILALGFIVAGGVAAVGQDYEKGLAAAQSGDFATALKEWRPLAEQGDTNGQYNLGVMYKNGDGVVQDYAEAVKWWRLAAEQGNVKALGEFKLKQLC